MSLIKILLGVPEDARKIDYGISCVKFKDHTIDLLKVHSYING